VAAVLHVLGRESTSRAVPERGEGARVADDVEKLLRFIARRYLAREEALEIERDASAADEGHDIVAGQRRAIQSEEQKASDMAAAFREGLQRAEAARRAGGNAISLDDRKVDDDRMADALIHFLVRSDIATSTTRETEQHRYIYTIAVDWDALDRVARQARVNLGEVLGRGG
jgi:hypothetical protein